MVPCDADVPGLWPIILMARSVHLTAGHFGSLVTYCVGTRWLQRSYALLHHTHPHITRRQFHSDEIHNHHEAMWYKTRHNRRHVLVLIV